MTSTLTEVKDGLARSIRDDGARLTAIGDDIFTHPELGYREERTATLVAEELKSLGLDVREGLAITGVSAAIDGARPGPTIAVVAELDALRVPDHPAADPQTGAAHACGHNIQIVHLLAIARALCETDVASDLSGRVVFFAVPAEEFSDTEWALEQIGKGRIEFVGGKQELIRLGHFAGIDMAMLTHGIGRPGQKALSIAWTHNGFLAKYVRFLGRASHAASSPHLGINALNAAMLALQAVNAHREAFRDEDHVRIHSILTGPTSAANVVPPEARVEAFVRAATFDAMRGAEARFDRAMRGAATAVGAGVEIHTLTGYMPLDNSRSLGAVFRKNAVALVGEEQWGEVPHNAASTDAGDLGHVLPFLHPLHGGCVGANHSAEFRIVDPDAAYISPAIAMAWTLVDLLGDGARVAREALEDWRAPYSVDEYLRRARATRRHEVCEMAAGLGFDATSAAPVGR